MLLTWNGCAEGERVSAVARHAATDGTVVNDNALGV